ncbi:hypothetical protein PAAG_11699 [Paracoccidioides lutzii Pb01]|uniref:Uncharacterized protein n=1 Tax=Paracoccidioides lutzii (strain ATCC MYA-826 / Pb01) TaxID=502779 RepID=A0A0A2V250_PARBA|nr:hypothetical protein PAAG_11699 [Paracoccidioides lutzii Pb01]KGQ01573.1 hypothetical protein PAAG_11699 [Paracoccidioides lutzii Pb01]
MERKQNRPWSSKKWTGPKEFVGVLCWVTYQQFDEVCVRGESSQRQAMATDGQIYQDFSQNVEYSNNQGFLEGFPPSPWRETVESHME